MTFGSLFAGIGGLDLGLERAGMTCKWQVEINQFARKVLAKHWPDVPKHDDVRTFPVGPKEDWNVDLICGGFPCQDISNAGRRAGIDGERSGLWREYIRIVREIRPRYVVVENVSALLGRGIGRVLGDLAESGYDAEWECIPAASVGAPHIRDRVFILAYPKRPGLEIGGGFRRDVQEELPTVERSRREDVPDPESRRAGQLRRLEFETFGQGCRDLYWPEAEPPVCGVADGVPSRVDRLRTLGNSVVPQIGEFLGRLILSSFREAEFQ